ncbi:MAG: transposase [Candidatus Aminicenantes bacterium]|nr:transposase [Candidatus Aminicenantes bacterium]
MTLNQIGDMVKMEWEKLSNRFKNIVLDEYVMMPNHIHGIIQIIGASPFQAVNDHLKNYEKHHNKEFLQNPGGTNENSISRIIQGFKSISTNTYIHSVTKNHWPAFEKYFWQRDFFDRIIRDPEELEQVRNYIINNPQNWESDEDNPINIHNKHTTQTT